MFGFLLNTCLYCFSSVRPFLRPKQIFRLCISCFYISHHCMTPMFVNEENCTIYKQSNKYYIFTCLYSIKCYYHMCPLFIYNLFLDFIYSKPWWYPFREKNESVIGSLAQNPLSVDLLSLILIWNWIRGRHLNNTIHLLLHIVHYQKTIRTRIKKLTKNIYFRWMYHWITLL